MRLTVQAIQDAYESIDPIFLNTAQFELDTLNQMLGGRLVLKVETLNPIRSFKGRGTDYFVKQNREKMPFVCASAGNFGQGMAYACQKLDLPLSVFAATTANPLKLQRMREFGAEVLLAGDDFDAAKDAAKTYAEQKGLSYVEDGKVPEVSIGAGTIGLELSHYPASLNAVLVPLGNGALINGIGTWFKAKQSGVNVIGVVAETAPSMDLSWRKDQIIETETAHTIADGIAVRKPVPEALEDMKSTVDDIVQVSEASILEAMKLIHQHAGLVLEPAGAVGFAAAIQHNERFKGITLAAPLCGSNVTLEQMKKWF